ncbi:hypothetical protein AUC47_12920 [Microbacterium sp. SZ1]|uniref:hypothetical protein n=1 Tax=Microbacterium sp. SZ1 TaxID=1849736 RepID=UPI000BC5701D|nr:hypothetical protein [Microbacterium sp. SZ1]PCE15764.1 hypothetical protein AUC47_12920 [Microbacterium sp. SZ1]
MRQLTTAWTAGDIAAFLLAVPVTSLVAAVFLALVISAWRARAEANVAPGAAAMVDDGLRRRYRPQHVGLGILAASVGVAFFGAYLFRVFVPSEASATPWLRFTLLLIVAAAGFAALLVVILRRRDDRPGEPVLGIRRTWATFTHRSALLPGALAAILLVATSLIGGAASSTDAEGRFTMLEIPVPNVSGVDPVRVSFYGWAYGGPVLVMLGVLLLLTWAVLHGSAAVPFLGPGLVAAERELRRKTAAGVISIFTSVALLTTADAWRLIGRSASVSSLEIMGENEGRPYEVAWRHTELASVASWGAPILEVCALTILLLVVIRMSHHPVSANTPRESERVR